MNKKLKEEILIKNNENEKIYEKLGNFEKEIESKNKFSIEEINEFKEREILNKTKIIELTKESDNFYIEIEKLVNEKEDLERKLKKEMKEIKKENLDLEKNKENFNEKLNKQKQELSKLKEDNCKLSTKIKHLTNEVQKNDKNEEKCKISHKENEEKIELLEKNLKKQKQILEQTKTRFNSEREAKTIEIKDLYENLSEFRIKYRQLNQEYISVLAKNSDYKIQVNTLQKLNEKSEKLIQQEIEKYNKKSNDIEKENNSLNCKINEILKENSSLKSKIDEISKENKKFCDKYQLSLKEIEQINNFFTKELNFPIQNLILLYV